MRHLALIPAILATPLLADPAEIVEVAVDGPRFSVTLRHGDTGWDDYADGWRVELANGTVLGTRVLAHPHVTEQPFTRSHAIDIPEGIETVFVRASTSVEGWGDATVAVGLSE